MADFLTQLTDSRCAGYIADSGSNSRELDALDPLVISGLIESAVTELIEQDEWDARDQLIKAGRQVLQKISDNYIEVETFLAGLA